MYFMKINNWWTWWMDLGNIKDLNQMFFIHTFDVHYAPHHINMCICLFFFIFVLSSAKSYLVLDWVKAGRTCWFVTLESIVTFLTLALSFIIACIWHRTLSVAVASYREKRAKLRGLLLFMDFAFHFFILTPNSSHIDASLGLFGITFWCTEYPFSIIFRRAVSSISLNKYKPKGGPCMLKSDAKRISLCVKKWCQWVLTKRKYVTSW